MSIRDDGNVIDPGYSEAATPGGRATCADCGGDLIAKCGEINIWHWAHAAGGLDCIGSGEESAWHSAWKMWAKAEHGARTEVKFDKHRADIVYPDGRIVELQSTYLNGTAIRAREEQYGDQLAWVYRITPGRWDRLINTGDGWFAWRRPAPSMALHRRPLTWHHGDRLYSIAEIRADHDFEIRFERGERDGYGPNLYHSDPAPFDVAMPFVAVQKYAAA